MKSRVINNLMSSKDGVLMIRKRTIIAIMLAAFFEKKGGKRKKIFIYSFLYNIYIWV